jgi:7,8-dihydropterin-6-yl-methyl-4-(beta-D-ribofuranosyl)aminobenzene 5'-phosphate synthase
MKAIFIKMTGFTLREVDKVEVTIVVDNYTDLLLGRTSEVVRRPGRTNGKTPLAEHGLSVLIKVFAGDEEHVMLMDAGMSPVCFLHNLEVFKVDVDKIECVALSHGHRDHFGGLLEFFKQSDRDLPLTLHPAAFLERRLNIPNVGIREMPRLDESALIQNGAIVHKDEGASTLCNDLILSLGAVERVTDFEKGFPWAEAKIDGEWVVDPFLDDQGVAVNVRGKGLVIIGGCSHAGIINTIKHAQKASAIDEVHAVLGGFHLPSPLLSPIIQPTIDEMKHIGPDYVVPMHCTGWEAMVRFSQEMPEGFLLNSVGTTYSF